MATQNIRLNILMSLDNIKVRPGKQGGSLVGDRNNFEDYSRSMFRDGVNIKDH